LEIECVNGLAKLEKGLEAVSAVFFSTDGYVSMIFAFSNLTPCFLT
jgi:hypothetical protein